MRLLGIGTVLAAAAVTLLTLYAVPLNPPLGDCFGGTLNQDPLHCYVLEQAQRDGIIDVEKVYDADGVLYFSLRQEDPVGDDVKEFLEAKSYEFYDRWPDEVPVNPWYDDCVNVRLKPTYRECYLELGILPKSMVYADITFHTGGETARRLEPGWASWRQVWPVDAAARSNNDGASGTSGAPTTFDVSDVDVTNVPVQYCNKVLIAGEPCSIDPDLALSLVGVHGNYVQFKDPPEDEAGLAAIRYMLNPCYNVESGPCTFTATETKVQMVDGVETLVDTTVEVYQTSYPPARW